MAEITVEQPTRRIVPAGSAPAPAVGFPASVFHLGASLAGEALAAEPEPASEITGAPPAPPAPADPISKVDRAIAYVGQYGEASRPELAAAMGLESPAHVKSFLKTPLADGRLVCDGDRYMIGTGKPPAVKPRRAASTPTAARPAAEPVQMNGIDIEGPHHVPAMPAAQILLSGLGITVRTDGSLRIAANGKAIDLDPAQARLMHAFGELLAQHGVATPSIPSLFTASTEANPSIKESA